MQEEFINEEDSLRRWLWTIVVVIELVIAGFGVRLLIRHYENVWFTSYSQCFEDGDDACARHYAKRIAWLYKKQSALYLTQLDVARSIRLQGADRRELLEGARQRLVTTDLSSWSLGEQGEVVLLRAYLDAELGEKQRALDDTRRVCQMPHSSYESFAKCMQSIYGGGGSTNSRSDSLKLYEELTLALDIKLGDPVLLRFHMIEAMRSLDMDKARAMREAMRRDGSFTENMQKAYCAEAGLDESFCPNYATRD